MHGAKQATAADLRVRATGTPNPQPSRWDQLTPWLLAAFLFALNAITCKRLFFLNYSVHMESIEGSFMSISRYAIRHWGDLGWFPLWFEGMPFYHVYQPGLHMTVAFLASVAHWPVPRAYHFLTALAYCIGPVTLFVLCLVATGSRLLAFLAAVIYSLVSPINFLSSIMAADSGGYFNPRRLRILIQYGEGPHITALAILPVAILLLHLALTGQRRIPVLLAAIAMASIVITNWPGSIGLAMAVAAYLLSRIGQTPRVRWTTFLAICVGAYVLISPWIPPSTILSVQRNAQHSDATMLGITQARAAAAILLACLGLHWIFRRFEVDPWTRFFAYFLVFSGAVTLGFLWFDIKLLPQPHRFQTELEMALAGLIASGCVGALRYVPSKAGRWTLIAGLLAVCFFPLRQDIRYGHEQIKAVDIEKRVEYRMAKAFERLEGGNRVFAPGGVSYWMNLFTDVPQVAGCCDQSVPSFEDQIANFVIYTGLNAGSRDAQVSTLWLEAYGAHAVGVTGKHSAEHDKPFANPEKFNGVLRELWREGDDVIYEVPQRSDSLAHVVNPSDIIGRAPVNGLDTAPLEPYVQAIESPDYPPAKFVWLDGRQARVTARFAAGQRLSVQITADSGWHARVNGLDRPVSTDALGMLVVDPGCTGDCTVDLSFDPTRESDWTRTAQIAVIVWGGIFAFTRKNQAGKTRFHFS